MDLIDRQAAIDALMAWEEDSFWDEECLKHRGEPYWVAPSDVINQLPSAQPEVIRCRECKYASPNGVYGCRLERFSAHDKNTRLFAEDYCSAAERRTDEAD